MSEKIDNNSSENTPPQLRVVTQYLKDSSFENPHAPQILQSDAEAPSINVNVNVEAKPFEEIGLEVCLSVKAEARGADKTIFIVELVYAGLFQFENIPEEHLQAFVLVECPRLLFPFARKIIADMTRDGGFPPLLLDPIDFTSLYQAKLEQETEGQGATPAQQPADGITLN